MSEPNQIEVAERKQVAEALRESEMRYRAFFEGNPQPMWVYDVETLSFLAVNDAAIRLYGYSREEFLTMNIKELRPPEDVPLPLDFVSRKPPDQGAAAVWRHRKKDGTTIDAEITMHPVAFGGRRAELVSATDVTERKRMVDA